MLCHTVPTSFQVGPEPTTQDADYMFSLRPCVAADLHRHENVKQCQPPEGPGSTLEAEIGAGAGSSPMPTLNIVAIWNLAR